MNFQEWALKYMTDRGVFDDVAAKILNDIKAEKSNEDMSHRWGDNISDYPDIMLPVMAFIINRHVQEWCKTNAPLAWFLPMFQ